MNRFQKLRREHIVRMCKDLCLPEDVRKKSLAILKKAEKKMDFSGIPPTGIAASIVFLVHKESGGTISRTAFAKMVGVATYTIEKHMNRIREKLKLVSE